MNNNNGVRVYGLNQIRQWASCTNIFVTQKRKFFAIFLYWTNKTSNHKQNTTCAMQSSNQALIIMDWVLYDVLLSPLTFSTQILLFWHTEMVTTQSGIVSLFGICGGILVGTKIPCFDRRLKIEQSHHHFPQHWKLRHLPLELMYAWSDLRSLSVTPLSDPRLTKACGMSLFFHTASLCQS